MDNFLGHYIDLTKDLRSLRNQFSKSPSIIVEKFPFWHVYLDYLNRNDKEISQNLAEIDEILQTYDPKHKLTDHLTTADKKLLQSCEKVKIKIETKHKVLNFLKMIEEKEAIHTQRFIHNFSHQKEVVSYVQDQKLFRASMILQASKKQMKRIGEEDIRRIENIEKSTELIKFTVKKLQMLTIEQAQVVDRIDYNIKATHKNVYKAHKELELLYHSYNHMAWNLYVILLCVMMILAISLLVKCIKKY